MGVHTGEKENTAWSKHFVEVMTDPLWLIYFFREFLFLFAFFHTLLLPILWESLSVGCDKHLSNLCHICILHRSCVLLYLRDAFVDENSGFAAPEMNSFILVNGKKAHMVCL